MSVAKFVKLCVLLFGLAFSEESDAGVTLSRREGIPSFAELFGQKTDAGTKYEILGCTITNSKSGCEWIFQPNETCQTQLLLGKVFNFMGGKSSVGKPPELQSMTKSIFPPGAFAIKKIVLSNCPNKLGEVDFKCGSENPFDVIKEKLKITKAELSLKFNYKELKTDFSFSKFDIDLTGSAEIGGQAIDLVLKKARNSPKSIFKLSAKTINIAQLSQAFEKSEDGQPASTEGDDKVLVKSGGMFSKMVIQAPVIQGMRKEDGSYEFVVTGKATGISGVGDITGFVIVQKPLKDTTGVGVVAVVKNVQPLKILGNILGMNLDYIEIIRDISLDLNIEYGSRNLTKLIDPELQKLLAAALTDGASIVTGGKIRFNLPVKAILKKTGTIANLAHVPENMKLTIFIRDGKVSFKFPEETFKDGMNIVAALVPKFVDILRKYVFKSTVNIVIKKYDVNVKTKDVAIDVSIPDKVEIGSKLFSLNKAFFSLLHDSKGNVQFKLEAELQLASATANIMIERKDNVFNLKGTLASLNSKELLEAFGGKDLADKSTKTSSSFNFGISDLILTAKFGEGVAEEFRVKGTVSIFGKTGMDFEGFFVDPAKSSKPVARKHKLWPLRNTLRKLVQSNSSETNTVFETAINHGILDNDMDENDFEYHSNNINDDNNSGSGDAGSDEEEEPESRSILTESRREYDESLNIRLRRAATAVIQRDMGLAVMVKNIPIDDIIRHLFEKEIAGTNWMVNLELALAMTNTDKNLFQIPQAKEMVEKEKKKGVYFTGNLGIPADCMNNSICELAKKKIKPGGKFFVRSAFTTDGMKMEAGYDGGAFDMGSKVTLNEVFIKIEIGTNNEFSLNGKLTVGNMGPKPLEFEVSIGLTSSLALKVSGSMKNMWMQAFGIPNFNLGNLRISLSLQIPAFLPSEFELGAEIQVGVKDKELKLKAQGGLSTTTPTNNYIYGSLNKLTISACGEAFGFKPALPQVILDTGFPEALIVSFSANPKGTKVTGLDLQIEQGFTFKGKLNVLGYEITGVVIISKTKLLVKVDLAPVKLFGDNFVLALSEDNLKAGPTVHIGLGPTEGKFLIKGYLQILGISSQVDIKIDNSGIFFEVEGSLFGVVALKLAVKAPYGKSLKLEKAKFSVSACFTTNLETASNEATVSAKEYGKKADEVKKFAENQRTENEKWLTYANKSAVSYADTMNEMNGEMEVGADQIQGYEDEYGKCMVACDKLTYFSKVKCVMKCVLGRASNAAKVFVEKAAQKAKKILRDMAQEVVAVAKTIADQAKKVFSKVVAVLENVAEYTKEGLKAMKELLDSVIKINQGCFETSLEEASKACFGVKFNVSIVKQEKLLDTNICFETGFMKTLGNLVTKFLYPGVTKINEKIAETKAKFKEAAEEEKKLAEEQKKAEQELKKLHNDLHKEVSSKKKHRVPSRRWTMEEMEQQMYSETAGVSLFDDGVIEVLEDSPDYMGERALYVYDEPEINVRSILEGLSMEQGKCPFTRQLISSFSNISARLGSLFDRIENRKTALKREAIETTPKLKQLSKDAIAECIRDKCSEKVRQEIIGLSETFMKAHLKHVQNLDSDFEAIGSRLMKKKGTAFARQIVENGMTVKGFLGKLRSATKSAARNQEHKIAMKLNASYNTVKQLLSNEKTYQKGRHSFHSMRSNMAYLRDNISCHF